MAKKDRSGHCIKCGLFREVLHRDHIVPTWAGGSDDESNIQYLCANCHQDKTLAEVHSDAFREWRRIGNKKRYEDPEARNRASDAWTTERRERHRVVMKKRFEDPVLRVNAGAFAKGFVRTDEHKLNHKLAMQRIANLPEIKEQRRAAQQKRRAVEAERKALMTPEEREHESARVALKRAEMKLARMQKELESAKADKPSSETIN